MTKKVHAGKMRNLVTIETPTTSKDAQYAVTKSWATFCQWWAAIKQTSGSEQVKSGQIILGQTYEFSGRYYPGVTEKMRFHWGGRYFDIRDVTRIDEINDRMTITAVERVF